MTATASAADVIPVPDRFRFCDENPMTLTPYGQSRFGDLPGFVAHVIEHDLGVTPCAWDSYVANGETSTLVGPWRSYSIAGWLANQAQRRRDHRVGRNVCPDCWGTGVEFDGDGSLTGTVGNPVMCMCSHWTRVRPRRQQFTGARAGLVGGAA